MKKVSKAVVTGGAGFIGSHIVDELIKRGIETFVIDNLTTGTTENLKQHKTNDLLHLFLGDAKNIERFLFDINDIDVVFHQSAITSIPSSINDPMIVHDANVNTTLKVMNYCVSRNVKKFIFASSAAVYGKLENQKASEEFVCWPSSPYGASKLAVEDYLKAYQLTYELEPVILRYFNVYGPRQLKNDYSGVIPIFINQLLRGESPTIFGDGSQVRDFIHVQDIIQANMLAMENENAPGKIFNVATGNSMSVLELLKTLKEITKTENIKHKFGPPRGGDVKFSLAKNDKIKNTLSFSPTISSTEGLKQLVEYFRNMQEIKMISLYGKK